jgi:hypothetical protein
VKSAPCVVVTFIAICAFGSFRAVAQDTHSQATASSAEGADAFVDQQFALLRKDIRSLKKQLIAANLTLTDSEAAKFWLVYDQYSTELSKINDTRTALIKEYGDAYGSLTDEHADSLIRRWLDTDIAASELRRKCFNPAQSIRRKESRYLLPVGPRQHDDRLAADFAAAPGTEPGLSS